MLSLNLAVVVSDSVAMPPIYLPFTDAQIYRYSFSGGSRIYNK